MTINVHKNKLQTSKIVQKNIMDFKHPTPELFREFVFLFKRPLNS